MDASTRTVHVIKLGKDELKRSQANDYHLKRQFIDLLYVISSTKTGNIRSLHIQNGLPVMMFIEECYSEEI
jgi:hypothetical protein